MIGTKTSTYQRGKGSDRASPAAWCWYSGGNNPADIPGCSNLHTEITQPHFQGLCCVTMLYAHQTVISLHEDIHTYMCLSLQYSRKSMLGSQTYKFTHMAELIRIINWLYYISVCKLTHGDEEWMELCGFLLRLVAAQRYSERLAAVCRKWEICRRVLKIKT